MLGKAPVGLLTGWPSTILVSDAAGAGGESTTGVSLTGFTTCGVEGGDAFATGSVTVGTAEGPASGSAADALVRED